MRKEPFIPLSSFLLSMYHDLIKAETNAKGLQLEYLTKMAGHNAPLPVLEMVNRLELESFQLSFHFIQAGLDGAWYKRIAQFLHLSKKPPEGIFLRLAAKAEAQFTFSVSLTKDARHTPVFEPELDKKINCYVLTEVS